MRLRKTSLALCGLLGSLIMIAVVASAARADAAISSVAPAQSIDPVHPSTAVTYTNYLPFIVNCYPPPPISDPGFAHQNDMTQIHADAVWRRCTIGSPDVIVAIVDTGVSLNHPDLKPNLIAGYDFVDNDTVAQDGNGHGSNVAGIIGAALNGVGIVGVAPATHLLPVRVLNNFGSGFTSDVAAGITYAADHAQILNLSLGGTHDDPAINSAIAYAVNTRHRLVVAAAGNCGDGYYFANGCDSENQPVYPGAYSSVYPNVIAVAAVDSNDNHAIFSNSDPYVTVAAPGVDIYSDYLNNGYALETGTSQATPHVSGLAALIWARHPEYSAAQVEYAITATAVDLGSIGQDDDFGWGRIDALAAMNSIGAASIRSANLSRPIDLPRPTDHRTAQIASGRVLIKFKSTVSSTSIDEALKSIGATKILKQIDLIGLKVLQVPIGQEWTAIDRLRTLSGVDYVEPDYVIQLIP